MKSKQISRLLKVYSISFSRIRTTFNFSQPIHWCFFLFSVDLRLQLLDTEKNAALVKSLYGLLMLLPQSDAFRTLQRRLDCIPNIQFTPVEDRLGIDLVELHLSHPHLSDLYFVKTCLCVLQISVSNTKYI